MSRQYTQEGFSSLTALVVLIAIIAIGSTGWLVYQHNKPKVTNAASGTTTTDQTKAQQPTTTTTTSPGAIVGYLNITEWGVKLPLTSTISSASYIVSTAFAPDPDGLPSGVWLGLKSLSDASCNPSNNNLGNSTGAIGAILRVPQNAVDPVSQELYSQKYPNGVTIGSYYYGYQSWMGDNACTQQTTAQAADSVFATASRGITTAN